MTTTLDHDTALDRRPDAEWRRQAHDIKNVMATISLVAEELERGGPVRSDVLARRLLRGTARVLEICAASRGASAAVPEPSSAQELSDILRDVASLAQSHRDDRITVRLQAIEAVLPAEVAAAVFRIVANIATNAIEAMSGTDGELTISSRPDGVGVVIDIVDTGLGLGAHSVPRPAGGGAEGWGMGLTIARLLAVRIGAELDLIRSDGTGTHFRLRLPAPDVKGESCWH